MKIIKPAWPAPSWIKAAITTREEWGDYSSQHSFVSSAHIADLNADPRFVAENAKIIDLCNLPASPVWVRQTHSNIALEATDDHKEKIADATYTSRVNTVCAILTADCLPVFICDEAGTTVAAIHAGWRGLASGIIENTVAAMTLPALSACYAYLGPAIGPQKFEVGHDVYEAFTQHDASSAKAFQKISAEKWLADLYALATQRLQQLGLTHIYTDKFCTFSQPELFYSYRRDGAKTGRMASLIWIENRD